MRAFQFEMGVAVVLLLAGCSDKEAANSSNDAGADASDRGGSSHANHPKVDAPVGLWVRSIEGVGGEGVSAIAAHADGSFVVLGSYQGPGTFNPGRPDKMVLTMPDGESGTVLAHYAADGSLRALRPDPLGTGSGRVYMAPDDGMYVTGTGAFAAGSVMVPNDSDVFVARYAPDGKPMWASSASGEAGMGAGTAVAAWPDGGVVIAGTLQGTITFGVGESTETRLASTSDEIFLARYDANGKLLWAKRAINAPYLPKWQLEAAADGGIVVYGTLENVTTFNPDLADETKLMGGNVGFIVKLDDAGKVQWSRALSEPSGTNRISDLATFPDGSLVVTGSFERILTLGTGEEHETMLAATGSDFPGRTQFPDCFIARFTDTGALAWARREGGAVWDSGDQIKALPDGAALVTGGYTNMVTFAAGEPAEAMLSTESNQMTAFLAVVEADGSMRWVREGVSGQVAPLSDGSIAIAGTFMGTTTLFPGEVGETTLASAGGWDVYVARIGWQ
jgi:hypothetical protein